MIRIPEYQPLQVLGLTDAVRVSAGDRGGCAIRATGTVSCWGDVNATLQPIAGITQAVDLVADGPSRGCALFQGGVLECWEYQLPVQFSGIVNPRRMVSNHGFGYCAIESGGQISCWRYGIPPQRGVGFDGP